MTSRRVGNTRLVKADPANPLYSALRDIILATYGPPAVVLEELGELAGVEHLYLFGSWAARYHGEAGRAPNDIDVLVIGTPDRDQVYEAGERAEKRLRLPVQVTIRIPSSGYEPTIRLWRRFVAGRSSRFGATRDHDVGAGSSQH